MATFEINWSRTERGTFEVEAESQEEAENAFLNGDYDYDAARGDSEYEVIPVGR